MNERQPNQEKTASTRSAGIRRRELLLRGASLLTVMALADVMGGTSAQAQGQPNQDRPNVVVMMADNVGYGDIGAYGAGEIRGMPTPRIKTP